MGSCVFRDLEDVKVDGDEECKERRERRGEKRRAEGGKGRRRGQRGVVLERRGGN